MVLVSAAMLLSMLGWMAQTALAASYTTKWGYIPMSDGAKLRYTVWLPPGKGPFPTLMNYEGYQAGTQPDDSIRDLAADAVARGYAVAGVSLRGSGCSDGTWELFNRQQGEDGATAVDWLAQQPWSTGKVALFSYSYGGIMQLWVAAARPKHLVAIGPGNVVADTYRDIAWPGGILNSTFPPAWGAILNASWKGSAQTASEQGDTRCAGTVAQHLAAGTNDTLLLQAMQHPWDDRWHYDHSVENLVKNIDVPVLGIQSWEDEEVGPRGGEVFNLLDPAKTWLVATNGFHEMLTVSQPLINYELQFYDHFLKGINNGFQNRPHVQIWNETSVSNWSPRTITYVSRLPVRVNVANIPLGSHGLEGASGTANQTSYSYPAPSPTEIDASGETVYQTVQSNTWTGSTYDASGRATFTTPPLTHAVTTYGPGSADLWVSTTAPDVDLQVTITEVRPDGQEMYVQRGWLRASDRALGRSQSTDLDPWHPFTKAAAQNMPAGKPQLLRVEIFPFSHTFRAGSSIRMYVEMPSTTGLWGFDDITTPQTVTVYHDAAYPSRLVLGLLPHASFAPTLPACGTVHSEPCRPNPVPQPSGHIDIKPRTSQHAARKRLHHRATHHHRAHRRAHSRRHRHHAKYR